MVNQILLYSLHSVKRRFYLAELEFACISAAAVFSFIWLRGLKRRGAGVLVVRLSGAVITVQVQMFH